MIHLTYTIIGHQSNRRAAQEALHRAGRFLLFDVLHCTENDLRFRDNRKPFLPGGPHFNISHSGQLALLAVCDCCEIGCDVEELGRPLRNEEAIRRKIAQPGQEDLPTLALWVAYEARFKAGGRGDIVWPNMPEGYVAAVCCSDCCCKNFANIPIEQKFFE